MKKCWLLPVFTILLVLCATAAAEEQKNKAAQSRLQDIVPKDAMAVLYAPSLGTFLKEFKGTLVYTMFSHEGSRACFRELLDMQQGFFRRIEKVSTINLDKLFATIKGEVLVIPKRGGVTVALEATDNLGEHRIIMNSFEANIKLLIPQVEQDMYNTARLTIIPRRQDATTVVVRLDTEERAYLMMFSDIKEAKTAVDILRGEQAPKKDNAFRAGCTRLKVNKRSFCMYLDLSLISAFLPGVEVEANAAMPAGVRMRHALLRLLVKTLATLDGLFISQEVSGKNLKDTLFLQMTGCPFLTPARKDAFDSLALVPDDVEFFSVADINFVHLFDTAYKLIAADPVLKADMDVLLKEFTTLTGVTLKEGLLAPFDGETGFFINADETLAFAKIKDADTLAKGIDALIAAGGDAVERKKVAYKNHTVNVCYFRVGRGNRMVLPFTLSWTFHKDFLLVALSPQVLKAAVLRLSAPDRKTIRDNPAFTALLLQCRGKKTALAYSNFPAQFRRGYQKLMVLAPLLRLQKKLPFTLHTEALPPAEEIGGDLSGCLLTATTGADGVKVEILSPMGAAGMVFVLADLASSIYDGKNTALTGSLLSLALFSGIRRGRGRQ